MCYFTMTVGWVSNLASSFKSLSAHLQEADAFLLLFQSVGTILKSQTYLL